MKFSPFQIAHIFASVALLCGTAVAQDQTSFELPSPDDEKNFAGEGQLRRYPGYVTRWPEYRKAWSEQVEQDQGAVVFLGDSITQGWGKDFKGKFAGIKTANRGIGGDTTRGMLIRLEQDVLSLNPSAIVMLMGTNDIEVDIAPRAIGRNFEKIIAAIKAHDPKMPIILCRMFPSSPEKDRPKETIAEVNAHFDATVKEEPQVTVLDTWTLFAADDGNADPAWFRDLLHLNPAGYDRWAAALLPVFAELNLTEAKR